MNDDLIAFSFIIEYSVEESFTIFNSTLSVPPILFNSKLLTFESPKLIIVSSLEPYPETEL